MSKIKVIITEQQFNNIFEVSGGSNKLAKENFIERSQQIHQNPDGSPKYDYSSVDWVDTNTKVKIYCPEHNEFFEVFPNKHLQGGGKCPYESKRLETKHSDEEIAKAALEVSNASEFESQYPSEYYAARKRERKNPGFFNEITKHFKSLAKESFGEKQVASFLDSLNIRYERQKRFFGCKNVDGGKKCRDLPFDFYLPDYNTCIEFDGEQHFKPSNLYGMDKFLSTKKNDLLKNEYCKNKMKLIRIHYKKIKDFEKDLENSLKSNESFITIGPY